MTSTRILFVCMGNICRSPTAEAVFRHAAAEAGLSSLVYCDSAGTHDYHIGDPPDARSIAAARHRGYDMTPLRARQVGKADFSSFDFVLAMDRQNLAALIRLRPSQASAQVQLFSDFHDDYKGQDVPDPYYGNAAEFERVLDMVEAVSASLIQVLRPMIR